MRIADRVTFKAQAMHGPLASRVVSQTRQRPPPGSRFRTGCAGCPIGPGGFQWPMERREHRQENCCLPPSYGGKNSLCSRLTITALALTATRGSSRSACVRRDLRERGTDHRMSREARGSLPVPGRTRRFGSRFPDIPGRGRNSTHLATCCHLQRRVLTTNCERHIPCVHRPASVTAILGV